MSEPPIDPEMLRQQIYDAGRSLGRNDPFLASELTDSVMHFLEQDYDGLPLPPRELLESVTKIVSELGHPQLAIAIESNWTDQSNDDSGPEQKSMADAPVRRDVRDRFVNSQLCNFTLTSAYPSSIVAAHELGLIELMDLDLPFELVGGQAELSRRAGLSEQGLMLALAQARHRFGRYIELNLPEAVFQIQNPAEWCQTLAGCLDMTQLRAYFHVPRILADATNDSSLFADVEWPAPLFDVKSAKLFPDDVDIPSANGNRLAWIKELAAINSKRVRLVIHVEAADFDDSSFLELINVIAAGRVQAVFAYARGDQEPWRVTSGHVDCPGELVTVRANLPALLAEMPPAETAPAVLDRLGGLVRLAFAAGRAKQAFLRRNGHPAQREGFLLDRSAVIVRPVGIAELANQLALLDDAAGESSAAIMQLLRKAARECSTHGPVCLLRPEPHTIEPTSGLDSVPSYVEEVCMPDESWHGVTANLLEMLRRLYRETRVSAVWLNGGESTKGNI